MHNYIFMSLIFLLIKIFAIIYMVNDMNDDDKYIYYNNILLEKLSYYLNYLECSITKKQIKEVTKCGVSTKTAYMILLSEYLQLDNVLKNEYLEKIIFEENENEYINNNYYKDIHFEQKRCGKWIIKQAKYKEFELFVRDDFKYNGKQVLPQLGYFTKDFSFPAIYENNRLWMSVTPNEINTMKKPIDEAFGNVLTFGLGLGYFSYMASLKENVKTVTIVEKNQEAIDLFKQHILPKFKTDFKITIIKNDAYDFLKTMNDSTYDYVFVDIYHDASDGLLVYNHFKEMETKFLKTKFSYWIEETIKYYKN